MDKTAIISCLEDIQLLSQQPVAELQDITNRYPYFLPARLLLLKKLHSEGSFEFESQLKLASIQSVNRKRIYELIYQEQIQETIQSIELIDSKPTAEEKEVPIQPSVVAPKEEKNESTEEISIPLTQLSTIDNYKLQNKPTTSTPQEEKQLENSEVKSSNNELEKEILQYAISYSIEKEVMDDIEEQKRMESEEVTESISEENTVHTFTDWLKTLENSSNKKGQNTKKQRSASDLIDSFIKSEPQITKPTKDESELFTPSNMSKLSIVENKEFVTETLAKIYEKQGNYPKAIQAYEKLSLKFPEKKFYFADQIKKLKNHK